MTLTSKTLLLPSIVLLIGMIFGAIVANAFAYNPFKNIADDPFKNIGEIDDHGFPPVGYVDKLKIIPYSIKVIPME
jgi:hypothetical protein